MARHSASQLTLGLFDSTALGGSLGMPNSGGSFSFRDADDDIAEPVVMPEVARVPAVNFRLSGDRGLAKGWKARAADNIAAVRLLQQLEQDERAATHEEQVRLARFIGFGASELANGLFPLPGEDFRAGWETLGAELHGATTDAERAGLMRATQLYVTWNQPRIGFAKGETYDGCSYFRARGLACSSHLAISSRLADHACRPWPRSADTRRLCARPFGVQRIQRNIQH